MRELMLNALAAILMTYGMLAPIAAAAPLEAGKVIMSRGVATATGDNGEERSLNRRAAIYVGDTLTTGADSMLQLRFTDKALMTLRENTRFTIEEYSPGDEGKGGAAIMQLLEGGFRTITGSIGKGDSDAYKVSTHAASIGIRGTHYEALESSGQKLLLAVWQGGVRVENAAGALDLGEDVAFRFSAITPGQAPEGLLQAPPEMQQGLPIPKAEARRSRSQGATADDANSAEEPDKESESTSASSGQTAATGAVKTSPDGFTDDTTASANNSDAELISATTIAESNPVNLVSDPETTNFTDTNPDLSGGLTPAPSGDNSGPAIQDPRLTVAEYEQFINDRIFGAAVVTGAGAEILATIIAPQTITPFDYTSAGPVTFNIEYSFSSSGGTPPINTVTVMLQDNITDLAGLIADIDDDLSLSGAPIGVRESMQNPGKLEFYTTTGDVTLLFGLVTYDPISSTASSTDIAGTLGGIMEGTYGYGSIDGSQSANLKMVFDANGEPVFMLPDVDEPGSGSPPSTVMFFDPDNFPEPYTVVRRGDAILDKFDPSVGGRSNISWGLWKSSASAGVNIYDDVANPDVFRSEERSIYWLSAEAANTADLTGTANFATTGDFIGSGSDGAVTAVNGSFQVDFDSGVISNGLLDISTASQNWSSQLSGSYQDAQAYLNVLNGDISGSVNCSGCVTGNLNGIFAAPGDAFAGSFDLQQFDDPDVHVEGLLLMEQQ
ncbi:FecR family protein [Hahella sp. NBU794]|uniref:FecR family protein n=1 Tax=Hahella sp. NBU794 TaxID=3422590 RepID=UPI003D701E88